MIQYNYEPEKKRVAAYCDNGNEVGELTYIEHDGIWTANHTFVNPSQRGKSIAGNMLALLVEKARTNKVKIKPLCPYVVQAMVGKEEFTDILAD